jgi:FKBP-type peptidyl-prolyl cis-trans isomerase
MFVVLAGLISWADAAAFVPTLANRLDDGLVVWNNRRQPPNQHSKHWSKTLLGSITTTNWVDLTEDGGVKKSILTDGIGDASLEELGATTVTMDYTGTVATADWSVEEVIQCWLAEQQGVSDLYDAFRAQEIDESKLVNPDIFNEALVEQKMGVTARIKCKKLVMAAKRLATTRNEFTVGHVFDSYSEYQFIRGQTKLIRGMELGIAAMKPGEVAVLVIRSDYAYGSEGYRKTNGDVMVPPFATLQFEVKILR